MRSRISGAVSDGGVLPCIAARKRNVGNIGIRTPVQIPLPECAFRRPSDRGVNALCYEAFDAVMTSCAEGRCRKLGTQRAKQQPNMELILWLPTCKSGVQCRLAR